MEETSVVYARAPGYLTRRIGDELLILLPRERQSAEKSMHWVNTVGWHIWERLDGTRSVGELTELISREFDISKEMAAADLAAFLGQLKGAGVIVKAGATQSDSV